MGKIVSRFSLGLFVTGTALFLSSVTLPFAVSKLENRRPRPTPKPTDLPAAPTVDVVVPAYLEANVIESKIDSLRQALDRHPASSRIIVVASDSATADAARTADEVVLTERQGKAAACNVGISQSGADILVFSDANCEILPRDQWLNTLIKELRAWHLVSAQKAEAGGLDGPFWALERRIKSASRTTTGTLAVAGEFLAARRSDIRPIKEGAVLDDLNVALDFALRGLSVTVSPAIRTMEDAAYPQEQWERRIRIVTGYFLEALPLTPALLQLPLGRLFLAHKIARITIGCLGFWLAVIGASLRFMPQSIIGLVAIIYACAAYAGKARAIGVLRPVAAVCGLQAVPVLGMLRTVRVLIKGRGRHSEGIWRKVAR